MPCSAKSAKPFSNPLFLDIYPIKRHFLMKIRKSLKNAKKSIKITKKTSFFGFRIFFKFLQKLENLKNFFFPVFFYSVNRTFFLYDIAARVVKPETGTRFCLLQWGVGGARGFFLPRFHLIYSGTFSSRFRVRGNFRC